MNRDPKKQRKPYEMADFCLFVDHNFNRPEERAALAYMALVHKKQLPPWALAFFSDFKHGARTKRPISELVLLGTDAILLAPVDIEDGFEGLLIAEQSASGQVRSMRYQNMIFEVRIPEFDDYLKAENGIQVDIVSQPQPDPAAQTAQL